MNSCGDADFGFDCLFLETFYKGIVIDWAGIFGYLDCFGAVACDKVTCFGEENSLVNSRQLRLGTFAPAEAARRITYCQLKPHN